MLGLNPPTPLDLGGESTPDRPNRRVLMQRPGLKVVHLTLAPGRALAPHRHPGCWVLLQGLSGSVTVQLEEDEVQLPPQHLLSFSGETSVSPRNGGGAPSALLVTLVKHS